MYGGMDENRFAILMYGRIEDWKVVVKIHEVNFLIFIRKFCGTKFYRKL